MSRKSPRNSTRPNELLRYERERRDWTLEDVARRVDVIDYGLVGKWERGDASPSYRNRQKLCEVFEKSATELWLVKDQLPYWYMPHKRNDLFTGREEVLHNLHEMFSSESAASSDLPLAIRGLAGVGKTQAAIEYVFRHHQEYHTVLWARADSRERLIADYTQFAATLKLPEKVEKDQILIIDAVKNWLSRFTYWLLVLDNIEDMAMISSFLPSPKKGHILLTTRSQATMPHARSVDIERLKADEGALLLLRRTGFITPKGTLHDALETDKPTALEISKVMDGLPLALDQVGAYVEETNCSLSNYL